MERLSLIRFNGGMAFPPFPRSTRCLIQPGTAALLVGDVCGYAATALNATAEALA